MAGRVIEEGLRGITANRPTRTESEVVVGSVRSGYELRAHFSTVNNFRYLDYTRVARR
jgi:hypothetical protein